MQTLSFSLGLALRNSVVGSNHTREPGDGMELECYVEGVRGMANTSSACQPSWTFSRFGSFLSTTITISYLSALHLCRDDGCVAARSLGRYVKGGPGMANTTRVFSFVFSRLASRRVFSYSSYRFCAADTEGHFWRTVLRSTNLAFSRIMAVVRGGPEQLCRAGPDV